MHFKSSTKCSFPQLDNTIDAWWTLVSSAAVPARPMPAIPAPPPALGTSPFLPWHQPTSPAVPSSFAVLPALQYVPSTSYKTISENFNINTQAFLAPRSSRKKRMSLNRSKFSWVSKGQFEEIRPCRRQLNQKAPREDGGTHSSRGLLLPPHSYPQHHYRGTCLPSNWARMWALAAPAYGFWHKGTSPGHCRSCWSPVGCPVL